MFKKIAALVLAGSVAAPSAFAADKTMSLEDRVAELEANQSLNIFTFGGIFENRYDTIDVTQSNPSKIDNKLNYLRMRVSLNVDANVSKYIKFYSRLTTTKMYNGWVKQGTSTGLGDDLSDYNSYQGSQVYLEKAYTDLLIPDTNFVFSIGRLPTIDGEPANYYDGRARMGTYPLMTYNSVLDGMALSYNMDEHLPSNQRLAFRLIYTPFTNFFIGSGGFTVNPGQGTSATTGQPTGGALNTTVDLYSAQVDYGIKNLGVADELGFIVQTFQTGFLPYTLATAGVNSTQNIKVGGTTVVANMEGIAGTGADLSLSYLMSNYQSKGTIPGLGVGLGTNSADETLYGSIFLASGRYRFGSNWIAGAEYLHGSAGSFYYAGAERDLTSFYSTPGDGYHVYGTYKFTQNFSLRLGWMEQKYAYTSLINPGAQVASDKKIDTFYANLRLDF
jgi:hypothetical protein